MTLATLMLPACGSDPPTAPTVVAPAPIVVSITAEVVPNVAPLSRLDFGSGKSSERRNLHARVTVDATGGSAEVDLEFELSGPTLVGPSFLGPVQVGPGGSIHRDHNIPFDVDPSDPSGSTEGTLTVSASGTDERGGPVEASTQVAFTNAHTQLPAFLCTPSPTIMCVFNRFEFLANYEAPNGSSGQAMVTSGQFAPGEGGFFIPTEVGGPPSPLDYHLFVIIVNDCANSGFFQAILRAITSDVGYTVTVTDTQTNHVQTYFNPLGTAAEAITDTQAFATCP